ncbi:MAG: ABC transporter substrate-binding protein [Victivallales bacterium]|nr:ABC transporter substrate-binding protein [Victivallales bacterium]
MHSGFIAVLVSLLFLFGCKGRNEQQEAAGGYDNARIVSLAPSLTETLFALGLGDNVVGCSKFCKYPPQVEKLPRVGGFIDTDFEAIVRLRPTCVVLTKTEADTAERLRKLNVPVLEVPITTFDEIRDSFSFIGKALGRSEQAENVTREFVDNLNGKNAATEKRSAVIIIWRDYGNGTVKDVQVASTSSIYGRLAEAAGLTLLPDSKVQYPSLSPELLLRMQPDIIYELLPDCKDIEAAKNDWKRTLPELNAVKNGRIVVVTDDYAVLPGPRFTRLCQNFKAGVASQPRAGAEK